MNWTSTPPTTPGFYVWRMNEESCAQGIACNVFKNDNGTLVALRVGFTFAHEPASIGGQWCKLMPAEEIEKAWIESYDDVIGIKGTALPTERWFKSRAKRVMDGNSDNPITPLDPQSPYEGQV